MNAWRVRVRVERLRIARSPLAVAALSLWVGAALLAIGLGASRLAAERTAEQDAVAAAFAQQERGVQRANGPDAELGLVASNLWFPLGRERSPWSALSSGASEPYAGVSELRLLSLVPQIFDASVANPAELAIGRFDLAFVIVFLLPLLLIVLGHDALSRDGDAGVGDLTAVQPFSRFRLVLERLAVVGVGVVGALLLIVLVGVAAIGSFDGERVALWWVGSSVYALVWLLAIAWVACLRRPSAFSAIALVSGWLALTLAVPAAVNSALAAVFPARGVVQLVLDQRMVVNGAWDEPREAAMVRFRKRHPEHASLSVPEDRFSWSWYYAMQENGDRAVQAGLASYERVLGERQRWSGWAELLLPPLALQAALDRSAGTDLAAQQAYRESIAAYHEELKGFFFPRIAADVGLGELRFAEIPRHRFRLPETSALPASLAGLGGWLVAIGAALVRARPRVERVGER